MQQGFLLGTNKSLWTIFHNNSLLDVAIVKQQAEALHVSARHGKQGRGVEWPDPSDPAYQVAAALYEEPAQPSPGGRIEWEG